MSSYSRTYQEDHNIDWFAVVDKTYCHFASGGTYLPDEVNKKEQNRKIQQYIAKKFLQLDKFPLDVSINSRYIDDVNLVKKNPFEERHFDIDYKDYIADAVYLGFYSYCYWGVDKWGGILYRLLAYPKKETKIGIDNTIEVPHLQSANFLTPTLNLENNRTIHEFVRVSLFPTLGEML